MSEGDAQNVTRLLAISRFPEAFRRKVREAGSREGVLDVAFLGGLSDIYPFRPALNLDLDFVVLVGARDERVGSWLKAVEDWCCQQLGAQDVLCDLRLVRGPIKRVPQVLDAACVTLHPAVFTEDEYREASPLLRWAWRKYRCEVNPEWLTKQAPPRPTLQDLLRCRGGVLRTLDKVQTGVATLTEWQLPFFGETVIVIRDGEPLFLEYCLSKAAVMSRNHARCLGYAEADRLSNDEFADWYLSNVLSSAPFLELMNAKTTARKHGYGSLLGTKGLTVQYLSDLAALCSSTDPSPGNKRGADD